MLKVIDKKSGTISEGYKMTAIGIIPLDWDLKPLGMIVDEITQTAGTEKYETVSISAGIGFVNQAKKFGKELSGSQYEKYIVLHKGDFSYNKGNSQKYPQGCIYRLTDRETAAVPNVFESFRIKDGVADYFEQLFVGGFLNRQLFAKINHGVRDNGLLNLTGKDFYSCKVQFPPIKEQKKIAEILVQYDKIINLCKCKLGKVIKLKMACMDKMFPEHGEMIPEIRFPGFFDTWEQRKLGEIADVTKLAGFEFTEHVVYSDEGNIIALRGLNIKSGQLVLDDVKYIDDSNFSKLNRSKLYINDIMFTYVGTVGEVAIIKENDRFFLAPNVSRIRIESDDSPEYISQYMRTEQFYKKIIFPLIATSSQPALSMANIRKFIICLPQNKEEQRRIAGCLSHIDNLITLHQRELDEMVRMKKALMQQLLTGKVRVKI